jgi:hypothetical protein
MMGFVFQCLILATLFFFINIHKDYGLGFWLDEAPLPKYSADDIEFGECKESQPPECTRNVYFICIDTKDLFVCTPSGWKFVEKLPKQTPIPYSEEPDHPRICTADP